MQISSVALGNTSCKAFLSAAESSDINTFGLFMPLLPNALGGNNFFHNSKPNCIIFYALLVKIITPTSTPSAQLFV